MTSRWSVVGDDADDDAVKEMRQAKRSAAERSAAQRPLDSIMPTALCQTATKLNVARHSENTAALKATSTAGPVACCTHADR